jgi:hypothetical protein
MPELLQPVPGIDPVAPVPSILTTARRLPDVVWKSGITWRPLNKPGTIGQGPVNVAAVTNCDDSPLLNLDDISNLENAIAVPYLARLPFFCEDVLPGSIEQYRDDARRALDAFTPMFISAAFLDAVGGIGGTDIGAGSPIHPVTAMAALLANYTACTGLGGAIVHAPPVLVPSLIGNGVTKQVGDVYQGPLGSLLDPGPAGVWQTAEGATTGTMYVTGPVEYDVSPIEIPLTNQQAFWDRRLNGFFITAQRLGIVRFDPDCVFSCDAFLPSPAQGEIE